MNLPYLNAWWSSAKARLGLAARDESGAGEIVAVVVIIAIVIVLGLLFQDKIKELFENLWGNVTGNAAGVGQK